MDLLSILASGIFNEKDSKRGFQFAVGDKVRISSDVERVKFLQKDHGEWNDLMVMSLGQIGRIVNIDSDNDLKVNVGGLSWTFNPEVVTELASGTENRLAVGDLVQINSDLERVKELQDGHGGWIDGMGQSLGKIGRIKRIDSDDDLRVEVNGIPWAINPEAVTKIASGTESTFSVGDLVMISSDLERVKALQNGHGGWDASMRSCLGKNGCIKEIDSDDDLFVDIDGRTLMFHPKAVEKVAAADGSSPNETLSGLLKILNDTDVTGDVNGELVKASTEGDLMKVKGILARDESDVNGAFAGHTALEVASKKGHGDVINVLIKHNVNIETEDTEGNRAIHHAVLGDKPDLIKLLYEGGASLNVKNKKKLTPLHIAVNKEHVEVVRVLLENGCKPNVQDAEGDTPLHDAISKENVDIMSLLLKHHSDMTTTNDKGFNAIQHAAIRGKPGALRILLNKLSQQRIVDEKKDDGFTALHIACCNDHVEVAELLVNQGKANMDIQNVKLQTPLHLAVEKQSTQIISLLVNAGCKLNSTDKDGDTSLHCVIIKLTQPQQQAGLGALLGLVSPMDKESCKSIACFLAAKGADLKLKNKRGKTPLDLCQDTDLRESLVKCHQEKSSPPLLDPELTTRNDQNNAEAGDSDTPSHLVVGDLVQICSDPERVKLLQKGHGEWIDSMLSTLGKIGSVKHVFPNNDVKVKMSAGSWRFNSEAVTKVGKDTDEDWSPSDGSDSEEDLNSSDGSDDEPISDLLKMLVGVAELGDDHDPLHKAAENGNAEEVKKILKEGKSDVNRTDAGSTALHVASLHGHINVIKVLRKYNVKVEAEDNDGDRAVHNAAFGDKPDVIRLLHEFGADINARDNDGFTPLQIGVNKENIEVVRTLLDLGCHPNLQDQEGDTALHDATGKKKDDMVSLLLDNSANVTIINNKGFNVLHVAAICGDPDTMSVILTKLPHSWVVDEKKEDGFTPLHIAALNNHAEVVELLVDQGQATMDLQNDQLQTPLHLAVIRQQEEVISLLVQKGCDLNITDQDGDTPLHEVMRQLKQPSKEQTSMKGLEIITPETDKKACGSIACFLAANGSDIKLKNTNGQTALDLCTNSSLCEAVVKSHREKNSPPLAHVSATAKKDRGCLGDVMMQIWSGKGSKR